MKSLDVQRFRKDLAAAITAGVPIRFGRSCTVDDLNRWCDEIQARFVSPTNCSKAELVSAIDGIGGTGSSIPRRFLAAFKTFAATHSMTNVLDGLTVTSVAERQIRRALRWPFIYLAIVLLMAILGLLFFNWHIEPTFTILRSDLTLPPAIHQVEQFSWSSWLPNVVLVSAITLFVACIGLFLGGFRRLVMTIGGRRFVRSRQTGAAIQTMALLDQCGIDPAIATEISCELTGGDESVRKDLKSAARDFGNASSDRRIATDSSQMNSGQHWFVLADYHVAVANQKLGHLKAATPVVLLTTVGAAIGLGYALTIYGPLVGLLRELVTAGI